MGLGAAGLQCTMNLPCMLSKGKLPCGLRLPTPDSATPSTPSRTLPIALGSVFSTNPAKVRWGGPPSTGALRACVSPCCDEEGIEGCLRTHAPFRHPACRLAARQSGMPGHPGGMPGGGAAVCAEEKRGELVG